MPKLQIQKLHAQRWPHLESEHGLHEVTDDVVGRVT